MGLVPGTAISARLYGLTVLRLGGNFVREEKGVSLPTCGYAVWIPSWSKFVVVVLNKKSSIILGLMVEVGAG